MHHVEKLLLKSKQRAKMLWSKQPPCCNSVLQIASNIILKETTEIVSSIIPTTKLPGK